MSISDKVSCLFLIAFIVACAWPAPWQVTMSIGVMLVFYVMIQLYVDLMTPPRRK